MQPSFRPSRRIERELRPQQALAHDRLSDPILVRRAKDGDARALATLCERHAARVERLARHVLGDREDARDAAQDTLARVCTRIGQFRGEAAFTTWLHRLTVNTCRDVAQQRRSRCTSPLEEDRRIALDAAPDREVELAELRAELRTGLAELPARQATVLVLKDAFGFSFQEISDASGMPVGTAKCYAHRGRTGMRDLLGREQATPA